MSFHLKLTFEQNCNFLLCWKWVKKLGEECFSTNSDTLSKNAKFIFRSNLPFAFWLFTSPPLTSCVHAHNFLIIFLNQNFNNLILFKILVWTTLLLFIYILLSIISDETHFWLFFKFFKNGLNLKKNEKEEKNCTH